MQATINHLQLNINFQANFQFYKDLMEFLGWGVVYEDENMAGFSSTNNVSVWFLNATHQEKNNYDNFGMNHIGIGVDTQGDVDQAADMLRTKKVELLFETPRHRPEFAASEKETYYQVMFESPDGILFEIVYTGEKA